VRQHLGRGPHRRSDRRGARRSGDQDRRRSSPLLGGLGGLRCALGRRGRGLDRRGGLLGERNRLSPPLGQLPSRSCHIGGILANVPLLSDQDIRARLASSEWRREGQAITREWKLEDLAQAIVFVNRVAEAAEAANHHPDIFLHGWNKV